MRAFEKAKPFIEMKAEVSGFPVFSESFLYERVGKCDARFILAIAGEYSAIIEMLGYKKVLELLYDYQIKHGYISRWKAERILAEVSP